MYCGSVKRLEIIHIEAMFADKKICLALLMGPSSGADEVWESPAWLFMAITDVAHGKQQRARRAMSTKERGRSQEAREQAPGGGGKHHQKSSQQNGLPLPIACRKCSVVATSVQQQSNPQNYTCSPSHLSFLSLLGLRARSLQIHHHSLLAVRYHGL